MLKIEEIFKNLKAAGRKAFIAYIMAGDPDLDKTLQYVLMLERCGADIIELGVPFSDPLADGPTIQMAAARALKSGSTLKKVLSLVKTIRSNTKIPIILMTYYNPVFKYGEHRFVKDAVSAGVDGVIIPDLPPEEAAGIIESSRKLGLSTIFLVAPTSTDERVKKIVSSCTGFVYYVSITGTTGSGLTLDKKFMQHISMVKKMAGKPVAVGFGVSSPEDAKTIAPSADGVIVGSAIVKMLHERPQEAERFIKQLREAI
jgi:tryptophan synthase alpha chain